MITAWKDIDLITMHRLAAIGRRYPVETRGEAFYNEVAQELGVDPLDVPGIIQSLTETLIADLTPALEAIHNWRLETAIRLTEAMGLFTESFQKQFQSIFDHNN